MIVLGFDYGQKWIGVAIGNTELSVARPLCCLGPTTQPFDAIAQLIARWQPQAVVVGLPVHPDGQAHQLTGAARRFGAELAQRFTLPVHWVDERYSSRVAQADLAEQLCGSDRGRRRSVRLPGIAVQSRAGLKIKRVDAYAAQLLLQQFLDEAPRSDAGAC